METVSLGEDSLFLCDLRRIKVQSKNLRYDIKKFIYWYWCKGYSGIGCAIFLDKNDKWHIIDLGHCSCFGPVEDLKSVPMEKEQVLDLLKNGNYTYFDEDGDELTYVDLIDYLENSKMTKMLKITQDTKNLYGWIDHGHLELEVEKEKWNKMSLKRRRTYFERHADMVIDDYKVKDYHIDEAEPLVVREM